MLIWYYITSILLGGIMVIIGQPLWAIIPAICIVVMSTGAIQAQNTSIQSVQQFATDNIMLLSWIILQIGVNWMMYLAGYPIIISTIYLSIGTIIIYCISLITKYTDGIIVGHQSSIVSYIIVSIVLLIDIIQNISLLPGYLGIATIYSIMIGIIMVLYWMASVKMSRTLPHHFRDEAIILRAIIIPIYITGSIVGDNILIWCCMIIIRYIIYGGTLWKLSHYLSPIEDKKDLTIDLILKGYKTSHISYITRRSRVNNIFTTIEQIHSPIRLIIQHIPNIAMISSYIYLTIHLIIQGGIMMSDFLIYCLTFVGYVSLSYLYKLSGSIITIDNIAPSFVLGYLSIMIVMIVVFAGDPISGSVIGILWIIINALTVTQYHTINLNRYLNRHHVKRRIWANTAAACIIIGTLVQLPIDGVMIIPIILIIAAVLGFTIAQSYSTLRTLK